MSRRSWVRRATVAAAIAALLSSSASVAATARSAPSAAPSAAPSDTPALSSTLQEVTDFGPNPTGLGMYLYVPARVQPHPAVVVAIHYCTGSGPAMFTGTRYAALADRYGFLVVYPSATREGHCFDVSSPAALSHYGNSDPLGIVSMVRYVEQHQNANPHRVFATGISSGAMMTNVLAADYPDVFAAGSVMSGVPATCFATTDGSGWNSDCANGRIIKTPGEWGDAARAAFPGYRGPRPRMQLWHGTADTTLYYPNFIEETKQWTDVLHTGQTPRRVDYPKPSWTHSIYTDRFGRVLVDTYSVENGTHNVAFDEPGTDELAIQFFGLTQH
jgi:acetylxylan esterase